VLLLAGFQWEPRTSTPTSLRGVAAVIPGSADPPLAPRTFVDTGQVAVEARRGEAHLVRFR
jgi:hypothetical protein